MSFRTFCRTALLIAAAVLAPLVPLRALDPQKQIGQYGHTSWTSQRGLPGEAVYQILQTKDGYLWVRTGSGLARFDGVRFVSMDAEIGSEPVKAICMGADGDLLIRTATRTVIYKDRRFSDYLPKAPWPGGGIRVLFESREHTVFIGSDDYIYKLEKNGTVTALRSRTGWINAFLEDHNGTIWIAGSPSVYAYANNNLTEAIKSSTFHSTVTSMYEDHQHRIWAAASDGLYRFHENEPRLENLNEYKPNLLTAVLEDAQGNLWAGTEKSGIVRIAVNGSMPPPFTSLGFVSGLTDDNVLSLLEDREGSLWIGTASGLDQLRDTKMITFSTGEGLPTNRTKTAIATRDGAVEVFTDSGGLARIKDGIVTPFEHNDKLASLSDSAIFASRDGSLWLGTWHGLSRIQDSKVTVYPGDGHFYQNFVSAISEDDEGLIVTNSEERAFRFKDGKVSPFTVRGQSTPLTDGGIYVYTIYRDPIGTLWFGTSNGLYKLPPAGDIQGARQPTVAFDVTSIFDDGRGNLWIGGRTPGIVRFHIADKSLTHFTKKEGLSDSIASRILGGADGNLWISAEDGIYSVSREALNDYAEGRRQSVSSVHYGLPDGMKTTEASDVALQPGGCSTPDGKLWFTTRKGIVEVDPLHMIHNDFIPPVIVESVAADGVVQPFAGELNLSPGKKTIEIHYTALSFRIPERVRFKYRLDGYDSEWVDAGARRVAYYTNLPPGQYHFQVVAANDDGVWNNQGASVGIVLKPRFYQTNWFYLVCLLLAILIAIAANRLTTRLIRARADHLAKVVEEKTAELRQSQKELELLARFDSLTALPNRRLFTEDFDKMCTQPKDEEFTLLLVDVDNFKTINDTFGHDAGDAFLVETSKRLESAVRSSDKVARLGGDEFAILLPGSNEQAWLERICNRIVQSFAVGIDFKGVEIQTGVSVGVALFPQHGDNQEQLYKSADLALYEAKRLGRNTWRRFSPEMQDIRLCEK
ncbi:MAG: diguanylate cyclase [Terracidiphilus sp.]